MFTFIWADGQALAVESLKTQNSNVKVQLYKATERFVSQRHRPKLKGLSAMFKISLNTLVG